MRLIMEWIDIPRILSHCTVIVLDLPYVSGKRNDLREGHFHNQ